MSNYKVDITGIDTSKLVSLSHEENMELFKQMNNNDLSAKEKLIKVLRSKSILLFSVLLI